MEQGKRGAFISGEQGNKGQILRGTGDEDNIREQGQQENKFSILGEQGNKSIYFKGTSIPPWKSLMCQIDPGPK